MIRKILSNKCPNCNEGYIYSKKNIYFNYFSNKMNKECKNCGYKFEKEPGFFFGAMYVSYALTVAEALVVFVLGRLFFESVYDMRIVFWIILVLLLLSPFNMRISRIIWIYLMRKI